MGIYILRLELKIRVNMEKTIDSTNQECEKKGAQG